MDDHSTPAECVDWNERVALAQEMIPLIGRLHREKNVATSIFGRLLVNLSDIEIIKMHRYARRITHRMLPLSETFPIFRELVNLDLATSSIDVGRLAVRYADRGGDLHEYLRSELAPVIGSHQEEETRDVVLYGFGRIGRLLARILVAREAQGRGARLRAVVVRKKGKDDIIKRASLLRRDSVHGQFAGTITVDEEKEIIWANGTPIRMIYASNPAEIDYTAYGIDRAIVVDNTGAWRDREGLSQHLQSRGVAQVLLTAPGKGDIKNIVYGINHADITPADTILSAASCTTNAITPVLAALNHRYGIERGHVETVHSFTNDQNLIDNFHTGDRRGRAATLNMVLTSTGAAKAVAKALPALEGKLTGNAIRVPTPDVSMAVLNLTMATDVDADAVNTYLRHISLESELRQQINYIKSPDVVSTDFVGSTHAGIVDGLGTIATGNQLVVYVWYDNECGYSNQVIRIVEELAGARPLVLPARKTLDEISG